MVDERKARRERRRRQLLRRRTLVGSAVVVTFAAIVIVIVVSSSGGSDRGRALNRTASQGSTARARRSGSAMVRNATPQPGWEPSRDPDILLGRADTQIAGLIRLAIVRARNTRATY